ncbi:hypothetical protein K501DRAFT_276934 [Backusella circina FSU 941]|nr:hypothetical protein K501DRAFT_276934 [Backusella circina FSU 941]
MTWQTHRSYLPQLDIVFIRSIFFFGAFDETALARSTKERESVARTIAAEGASVQRPSREENGAMGGGSKPTVDTGLGVVGRSEGTTIGGRTTTVPTVAVATKAVAYAWIVEATWNSFVATTMVNVATPLTTEVTSKADTRMAAAKAGPTTGDSELRATPFLARTVVVTTSGVLAVLRVGPCG